MKNNNSPGKNVNKTSKNITLGVQTKYHKELNMKKMAKR